MVGAVNYGVFDEWDQDISFDGLLFMSYGSREDRARELVQTYKCQNGKTTLRRQEPSCDDSGAQLLPRAPPWQSSVTVQTVQGRTVLLRPAEVNNRDCIN